MRPSGILFFRRENVYPLEILNFCSHDVYFSSLVCSPDAHFLITYFLGVNFLIANFSLCILAGHKFSSSRIFSSRMFPHYSRHIFSRQVSHRKFSHCVSIYFYLFIYFSHLLFLLHFLVTHLFVVDFPIAFSPFSRPSNIPLKFHFSSSYVSFVANLSVCSSLRHAFPCAEKRRAFAASARSTSGKADKREGGEPGRDGERATRKWNLIKFQARWSRSGRT